MSWDVIVNAIKDFFNQPVPIIGCTIGCLLIFVLTIISKTSIGKKTLLKLKGMYFDIFEKYRKFEEESAKQIEELKSDYEAKLALVQNKKDEVEELLLVICDNIHNKKIQELVAKYKEEKQKEIVVSDLIEKKIEEVKKECEDYKTQLQLEFDAKRKELEEIIEVYKNEAKENSNSIKEAL